MPRLRVLFVVSECVPIVKTGGLGDVAGALPIELIKRGHDVRVVLPRYRSTKSYPAERHPTPLVVGMGNGTALAAAVWQAELPGGVPVYLLEHDAFFDREGIYDDGKHAFSDNPLRFAFLSRAGLALGRHVGFEPEVVHVHDWPTSLVCVLSQLTHGPPTLLTIHNLGYQGHTGIDALPMLGLNLEQALALGVEHFGGLNLLKGGIRCATVLSTVSPRYAQEVQTPEGGAGLDFELRGRAADLVGILNGIDESVWDPQSDRDLVARYGPEDLSGKAMCKDALQRELGLAPAPRVPLVGLVSRFVEQKGIDVFAASLDRLLAQELQFAVLGSGDAWAEQRFEELSLTAPNFRAHLGFNDQLAHRIEGGCDLFLMPSRYEPCGLSQMYSQRYGTLPIVRAVGGLRDTVEHEVDGFSFQTLVPGELVSAVLHATNVYRDQPDRFRDMQRLAMRKRMGWDRSAMHYDALYRLTIARSKI